MPRNTFVQYTSKDFATIRADIIQAIKTDFPQWTDHLASDFGMVLVEVMAGLADMMRFNQNVTATESFPATARSRASLCRHAEWFGYHPHPAAAAQVDLTFTKSNSALSAIVPKRTRVSTVDGTVTFETTAQLYMPPGQILGTVGAVHGRHIEGQLLGASAGTKNQVFPLLTSGLVMLAEDENSLAVYVGGEQWEEFASLPWAAGANGWRLWVDSDNDAYVRFGDGRYGNVPAIGSHIVAEYIVGGGVDGNVGAHTLSSMSTSTVNIASVTNGDAASGGADAESTEDLRANMPTMAITRGRAVTRDDYTRLSQAFGEIDKVDVKHPSANVIELYILPHGGVVPSAVLLESVRDYFTDIRMITEDLRVLAPTIVNVDVKIDIVLEEDSSASRLVADIGNGIRALLEGADFHTTVHIQDIYEHLDAYDAIEHATVTLLAESGGSGVSDIVADRGEILAPGVITVEVIDEDE